MDDLASALESLAKSLQALEQRVGALEQRVNGQSSPANSPSIPTPAASVPDVSSSSRESGWLSLLGKAMLAIAGAYVLRAATASDTIPRIPLVTVAIAYAFAWLIPAARAKTQHRLPSLVWAGTSAAILLPMVWELALRFRILPDALAASVLSLYVVVAAGLGWNRHFEEIGWITAGSTSIASLALAIAVHDFVPFIVTLLVIAWVGELAVFRQRELQVRLLVAAVADVALFALIWVYSGPVSSRTLYPGVSPLFLLMAAPLFLFLYAGSISTRIALRGRGISVFETGQTLIVFVLACWSFLDFWSGRAETVLGVLCLASAAAGYAACFIWFGRHEARRNYYVYATGSLGLLLAGCILSLPGIWLVISLGIFAVAVGFASLRARYFALELHALAGLIVIVAMSGSFLWSGKALAGAFPGAPGGMVVLAVASAILCSIALLQIPVQTWWHSLVVLIGVAASAFTSAALLVWWAVWMGTHLHVVPFTPHPQYVSVVRTIVACVVALALAWSGMKWKRKELRWLAWGALVLTAFKLMVEDMRHGHLAFAALSIFFYAATLLLVSRLIRPRTERE